MTRNRRNLKSSAARARHAAQTGRTDARRGRTRALAAALTLATAGIAATATAWLTNAHESTRATTTISATANASGNTPATSRDAATPTSAQAAATAPADVNPTKVSNAAKTPNPADASDIASASSTTNAVGATVQPAQQAPTPAAPSAAGQRAFIDPVTGQLRQPEHDELAAIAAAAAAAAPARRLARTANAAPESFGPDGSIEAVVPEDLHTFTVATRGPDGRITIEHAQGAKDAAKVMRANSAKKGPQAPISREKAKEDRNDR